MLPRASVGYRAPSEVVARAVAGAASGVLLGASFRDSGRDEEGYIWEAQQDAQVLVDHEGHLLFTSMGAMTQTMDGPNPEEEDPDELWPAGELVEREGRWLLRRGDAMTPIRMDRGFLVAER